MDRRDALKTSSMILACGLTAGTVATVIQACNTDTSEDWTPVNLNDEQISFVKEISELIIPRTDSPGAKDALVYRFVDAILDAYSPEQSSDHIAGIDAMIDQLRRIKGKTLDQCDRKESQEAMQYFAEHKDSNLFGLLKEWTVLGYCSSELGAKQHLNWDPIPGAPYRGCLDLSEIGKTWAI